jgi:hypothetical protein
VTDVLTADTPTYVIYHELIMTSKEWVRPHLCYPDIADFTSSHRYMTQVTAIDPYWLGEFEIGLSLLA